MTIEHWIFLWVCIHPFFIMLPAFYWKWKFNVGTCPRYNQIKKIISFDILRKGYTIQIFTVFIFGCFNLILFIMSGAETGYFHKGIPSFASLTAGPFGIGWIGTGIFLMKNYLEDAKEYKNEEITTEEKQNNSTMKSGNNIEKSTKSTEGNQNIESEVGKVIWIRKIFVYSYAIFIFLIIILNLTVGFSDSRNDLVFLIVIIFMAPPVILFYIFSNEKVQLLREGKDSEEISQELLKKTLLVGSTVFFISLVIMGLLLYFIL